MSEALVTDLYQLTMAQACVELGLRDRAVFEFFVRALPPRRNFLVAAGLEQVLDYLENFRFTVEDLQWLSGARQFRPQFIDYLETLRFTGDVDAMPEGTIFFPEEPILRVTAPMPEGQVMESRVMNLLHFQTLIASKAARSVLAAPGKLLVDFGLRRSHGAEAGLLAARASYLAGFSGTATVLAGKEFQIPLYGTMAHSFVQAYEREADAFEGFARANPENVVLLLDTYDTEAAAQKVVQLAPRLRERGFEIKGVRLDSGDLAAHAFKVREILDRGALTSVRIFVSGGLDEDDLQRLLGQGAPIDGFGVGTRLDTSADAPYLDCAYKLQEYSGRPSCKRSEGKATWPGRKQVFRQSDRAGKFAGDVVTLDGDAQEGSPLLQPVMVAGKRVAPLLPLSEPRARLAQELERLPGPCRGLAPAPAYPVRISQALRELAQAMGHGECRKISSPSREPADNNPAAA